MSKKLVFVVAYEGYQATEYDVPKEILEKHGYEITTASMPKGFAIAHDGTTTHVDYLVEQIKPVDYDGLVVIGGPGVPDHLYADPVYHVVQEFNMHEKMLAGICHGVRVLAQAGALITRTVTGWNG